jgi:hypothetical protein
VSLSRPCVGWADVDFGFAVDERIDVLLGDRARRSAAERPQPD